MIRDLRILPTAARQALAAAAVMLASPAAAVPLISEVFYDASGSDDGQSFVELYAPPGFDLAGLSLEGVNGSNGAVGPVIALSGVVPADGLYVVADVDSSGGTLVAFFDQLANFDFQNGPDSVVLRDDAGVFDAVGYGDFDPDEVFAGEGLPAVDPPAGMSVARLFADLDTDDNAFDFAAAEPSPGSAVLSVPEPSASLLAAVGVLGLLCVAEPRRRRERSANSTRRP